MPWVDAVTLDLLRDLAKAANDRAESAELRLATMAQSMAERAAERSPEPKAAVVQGMAPSAEQRATKAISDASITRAVDELVNKFGMSREEAAREAQRLFDALDSTDTSGISMMEQEFGSAEDGAFGPTLTAPT